jgi:hypothetical protein
LAQLCSKLSYFVLSTVGEIIFQCVSIFSDIISIIIDSAMKNATFSYSMIKVQRHSQMMLQVTRFNHDAVQGVYSPPRDDYATTPGNAQILFTCLPLMASWLFLTVYKLLYQWRKGATGEDNHVIQVRQRVCVI